MQDVEGRGAADRRPGARRLQRWLFAGALVFAAQGVFAASDYVDDWGPQLGTKAPLLEAEDQSGERRTLETVRGPNGLLIVFSRSVDW